MGELKDRRARKKAQTRELIRSVAQGMFAERGFDDVTIADIASRADVAVQTVFNHFTTKEELFFDGRVPWVTGPAAAVRDREPGVAPLLALRAHLIDTVTGLVSSMACPERRCYLATLGASDSLRARERELIHEAETLLAQALHLQRNGEPDEAARLFAQGIAHYERIAVKPRGGYYHVVSAYYEAIGESERALEYLERELKEEMIIGSAPGIAECRLGRCRLLGRLGLPLEDELAAAREAAQALKKPLRILSKLDRVAAGDYEED